MNDPRKPAAFRVEPAAPPSPAKENAPPRRPQAMRPDAAAIAVPTADPFDEPDEALAPPPPAKPPQRRSRLAGLFLGALAILLSLAAGLWIDALLRELFLRAGWLGWLAAGVTAVGAAALLLIVLREALALRRLASVERLRERAVKAAAASDQAEASRLVDELAGLLSVRPETAAGRRQLAMLRGDVIDGADLIRLAETELLSPLDARARDIVLDAAKRVSLVTAVSPRALVDVAYVIFEAARTIRRVSELYGGRPGWLGLMRLSRTVLAHLAVTGSIAVGDGFVQQIVGHGLAARLSAKLGEGVVNGMMTARIGLAAMEAARPLPFSAVRRPGMGDFLAALTRFTSQNAQTTDKS